MKGVGATVVTAIIFGTLYFGREVFVPIALAILLSFVLAPMVRLLQRWHIPRGLSVISANCRNAERRLIFDRAKLSLTGRNVHLSYARSQGNYVAIDAKCGLVVLKHQDRKRLRELCEWVGWQVVEEERQVTLRYPDNMTLKP